MHLILNLIIWFLIFFLQNISNPRRVYKKFKYSRLNLESLRLHTPKDSHISTQIVENFHNSSSFCLNFTHRFLLFHKNDKMHSTQFSSLFIMHFRALSFWMKENFNLWWKDLPFNASQLVNEKRKKKFMLNCFSSSFSSSLFKIAIKTINCLKL